MVTINKDNSSLIRQTTTVDATSLIKHEDKRNILHSFNINARDEPIVNGLIILFHNK